MSGNSLHSTETIVIGAGPGGYVAAIRAAQLGQKVMIVEKENIGGICLNVGCIPSKALITAGHHYHKAQHLDVFGINVPQIDVDFSKVQVFKEGVIKKLTDGVRTLLKGNKIEVVKGSATFIDTHTVRVSSGEGEQTISFRNAIVATGSSPIDLPFLKFSDRIIDSTNALNLTKIPRSLIVVGGGVIGIELAGAYANFGSKVTILEGQNDILSGMDSKITSIIKRNMKKKGIEIFANTYIKEGKEVGEIVEVKFEINDEEKTLQSEYLLLSIGRKPNTDEIGLEQIGVEKEENGLIKTDRQCRTTVPNIFAIGDIVAGPMLAHKASYEGKIASEVIAGKKSIIDYTCIPAVVFSEPEIAVIGETEESAKEKGIAIQSAKFPFAANGRAIALDETDGFVKLIVREDNDIVIGGQIIGAGASDMIAEITLAIESGLTAEDLALTIHAHPTLGEIVMETGEVVSGNPIHIIT